MKKLRLSLSTSLISALFGAVAFSQILPVSGDRANSYGVGVSFGGAVPQTDINEHKVFPTGRAFFRYYPAAQAAIELGIGLGTLEGDKDSRFFSSIIYPIDMRLLLTPVSEGKFEPYAFGGMGLMYFNPVDQTDKELPRNANKEYNRIVGYFPIGAGGQYYVSEGTSVGLSGAYNLPLTDNLDDIKIGGNDSYWSISLNVFAFVRGGNNDLDGDGLLNDEEKRIGTNPLNPDTDGDGLKDGEEVHTYKTDPLNPDTDADRLKDGEEVRVYHTNPLNKDTDGDALGDGDEVLTYHTDPLKPDTDGDTLTDGDEVLKYRTDPLKIDTDEDTLGDGDEVLKHHTDPLKKDTDGDGLADNEELLKHKTNPLELDTDKGGVDDGKEVQLALNPLDPSDDVPIIKVGERIILEGVNFETAKTTLLPQAKTILDQVAASLLASPAAEVAIHGHTDNVGGAKYNMKLSNGRAESVKSYLVSKGIPASRVTTKGFGFTKPVADNSNPQGRAKNRRIEFVR
ncbi:MAG TPA: OmpA family protein, partial [Bacteroidota bacterium]|nr:OmpA family protein [Bacteroidota bacterium]